MGPSLLDETGSGACLIVEPVHYAVQVEGWQDMLPLWSRSLWVVFLVGISHQATCGFIANPLHKVAVFPFCRHLGQCFDQLDHLFVLAIHYVVWAHFSEFRFECCLLCLRDDFELFGLFFLGFPCCFPLCGIKCAQINLLLYGNVLVI